jgi:hypothetical protein
MNSQPEEQDIIRLLIEESTVLNDRAAVEIDAQEPRKPRFKLERLKDLEAEPEPQFAIHGVLKRGDLAFFYGPAKTNKTFAALDMAAQLARGPGSQETPNKFAGQFQVNECWKTVYVTNEGRRFFRYRLKAAAEYHGLSDEQIDRLIVIREVPNLFDGDGLDELIEVLKEENADMIIFDTWARVTVGADENTTKDMGKVLENIERVKSELGGPAVLVVHHANKDGGLRGSTLLQGAADLSVKFNLERKTGMASMRSDGIKDGAEFDEIQFMTVEVLDSPRFRAIEWLEPSSKPKDQREDTFEANSAIITAYLQEYCNGPENAATVPEIDSATSVTAPTIRKHFASLKSSKTLNGVREIIKPKKTKKHVLHYYWDPNFEARS